MDRSRAGHPASAAPVRALPRGRGDAVGGRWLVTMVAWVAILGSSLLPTVIARELLGADFTLSQRAATACLIAIIGFAASVALPQLRPLRHLFLVLVTLLGGQWLVFDVLAKADWLRARLHDPSFAAYMPTEVVLNLLVTTGIVTVLMTVHRDRRAFFLARGDVAAPAAKISWIGVRDGDRWSQVGRNLTLALSLGTLAFLVLAGSPTGSLLTAALPALPAILFAAALNAFNEEVSYKASILSALDGPLSRRDALRMVAAYFGIAHFYGVPYGLVGVALAWFLGWILARSMAETRGMAWAWFIHFVQDVLIFTFMAGAAIVPGGR